MNRVSTARALLALAAGCALGAGAGADPADYVFVPYTTPGARLLAYGAGTEHDRDGSKETQQTLEAGWAATERWFTAAYAGWTAPDRGHFAFDEWAWLNHVQLAAPGAWPVDVGVLCELERPHDRAEGTGVLCGPTLQLDTQDLQINVNPLVEKRIDAAAPAPASLELQWQVKGMVRPGLELGLQGFATYAHGQAPSQTVGPVLVSHWRLAKQQSLQLDAGALAGLGAGSPRTVLRLRLQLEF